MNVISLEVPLYTVSAEDVLHAIHTSDDPDISRIELTEGDMVTVLAETRNLLNYDDADVEAMESAILGILKDQIDVSSLGRKEIPSSYRDLEIMERTRLSERAHGTFSYDIEQVRQRFGELTCGEKTLTDEQADQLADEIAQSIREDDDIWSLCDSYVQDIISHYIDALGKEGENPGIDTIMQGMDDYELGSAAGAPDLGNDISDTR